MTDFNSRLPQPKGIEKKLVEELRKIWNNDEFVFCNRVSIKTDEERQEIIDAIRNGDIKTSEDMVLYALQIMKDRENHVDG